MWTRYAIKNKFIRQERDSFYWDSVPNGDYFATGTDINNNPIRRGYVVNSRVDHQSVWSMWNDFCGRWGLNKIWFVDEDGKRHLIWRQY